MHGTIPNRARPVLPKWSDTVIARLTKLNAEGCSASEIAAALNTEFGFHFTRNSVIGKVHRMQIAHQLGVADTRMDEIRKLDAEGVSRRDIMARVGCGFQLVAAVLGRLPESVAKERRSKGYHDFLGDVATFKVKPQPKAKVAAKPRAWETAEAIRAIGFTDDSRRLTLQELEAKSCRWPVGDPGTADFRFCGADKLGTHAYCASHCRTAFTAVAARTTKADLPGRVDRPIRRFA